MIDVAEFPVLFDRMPAGDRQYFGFEPDGTINVLDVAELLAET